MIPSGQASKSLIVVRNPSARFGEQRQLTRWSNFVSAVGQRRRVFTGEAMVGELRPCRVSRLEAHGVIDTLDGQERKRIGSDEITHLVKTVGGGEQLLAFGRIDAVVVRMRDRRTRDA